MTVRFEALAPADAIAALEARGLRLDPSFDWRDVFQDEHAESFTVAKSSGFDILTDLFEATKAGLKDGTGQREFDARLIPILQEKGWWGRQLVDDPVTGERVVAQLGSLRRLKTIFDVNMRVSYAAGHWANFERNKAARPFLRYVAILDDRTRPEHRARHNLCLPVDHPYWNVWAPPCGWHCRCILQSLSQRDVDRMRDELRFEPPAEILQEWLNKRTGEISKVPVGIDPGWAYNPGKAGYRATLAAAQKLIEAPPALSAAAIEDRDWLPPRLGPEFADWFDDAAGDRSIEQPTVVVGALDKTTLDVLEQLQVAPVSGAITIDQETVRKASRDAASGRERSVPIETLRRLPELLANPRAILRDKRDGALLYVLEASDGGTIVVRIDFSSGAVDPANATAVRTNSVRSAGIVDLGDLQVSFYDILFGSL